MPLAYNAYSVNCMFRKFSGSVTTKIPEECLFIF